MVPLLTKNTKTNKLHQQNTKILKKIQDFALDSGWSSKSASAASWWISWSRDAYNFSKTLTAPFWMRAEWVSATHQQFHYHSFLRQIKEKKEQGRETDVYKICIRFDAILFRAIAILKRTSTSFIFVCTNNSSTTPLSIISAWNDSVSWHRQSIQKKMTELISRMKWGGSTMQRSLTRWSEVGQSNHYSFNCH